MGGDERDVSRIVSAFWLVGGQFCPQVGRLRGEPDGKGKTRLDFSLVGFELLRDALKGMSQTVGHQGLGCGARS